MLASAALPSASGQDRPWRDYGGGPDNTHYVLSKQITKSNVNQLEVAWSYPYGLTGFNPVIIGNTMYVAGRGSSLIALDATTGKEIWVHENLPGIQPRGINYWESKDRKDRRLIFSINSYLQEIDAATGKSILSFGKNGVVDLREGLGRDPSTIGRVQSNSPGKVFENLLLLGSAPGESYVSPPGDLRAYDVRTGKLVWQFHTIPHPGEFGYETNPKDGWKYIGGANTWGDFTIDEKRGIAYFPTGSPTYDFYGADRKGANLFGDSLLALDARTGKRLWHFQLIHHDLWDYDACAAPQLTTIRRNGKSIDVVAQAGKNGFLYVFDRVTGEPIWPIPEKPVPQSDVPGEHSWPTQPIPSAPPPFVSMSFTVEDVNPYLPAEEREYIRQQILSSRNDGIYTPPSLRGTVQMPGNPGGANWGVTAANPTNGAVYVLGTNGPALLKLEKSGEGIPPASAAFGSPASRVRPGSNLAATAGRTLYVQNCGLCHGANLEGGAGPALADIAERSAADSVKSVIVTGKGAMPAFTDMPQSDMDAIVAFLMNPSSTPVAGSRGGPQLQPPGSLGGPIVASGPAPGTKLGGERVNNRGRAGGNGGMMPYPTGTVRPEARYNSGYGLSPNAVKPPWATLTAYDLNKGTIKWQVPAGDDPALAAMGIHGTGSRNLRNGIIPTVTGLVFLAGGDYKIRAYDDETGKVLWEGDIGGASLGSPAMYEVSGRQYLALTVSAPGAGRGGLAGGSDSPRELPSGYVVFALPQANEADVSKR